MTWHKPRSINVLSFGLFASSAAILGGVVIFTINIDVLTNWRLTLPAGDIHAGDTIMVQSTYTKLRPVTGEAHRYIDCQNANNSFIRYPINQATADRAPMSNTGTGIILKIPESVPDLPASCRISVNIVYQVYPWRSVTEFNSTQGFRLLPVTDPAAAALSQTPIRTSPTQAGGQGQVSSLPSVPSSLQLTTNEPQPQSNSSQPSVVERVVTSVTGLLSRLF